MNTILQNAKITHTDINTLITECNNKLDKTANAASATKLATARTIRTNLASTSTESFDGTANIAPGVTGILPLANGGTGTNTKDSALTTLTSPKTNENWMESPKGTFLYKYEQADTTTYNLPISNCFVYVMKESNSRGVACAYGWASHNNEYSVYRNYLHDDTNSNKWGSWAGMWIA